MKSLKYLCVLITLLSSFQHMAQQAEFTTETVYVKFKSDSPTQLIVTSPTNLEQNLTRGFAKVQGNTVKLEGTVTDEDGIERMLINNIAVLHGNDGRFSQAIYLSDGQNQITFTITDRKGNTFEKSYTLISEQSVATAKTEDGMTAGKYYALLIAINDYDDPKIQSLDKPIKDAELLAKTLVDQYTFDPENVTLIKNATRVEMIDALDALRKRVSVNDNLLIFYAGHGLYDKESELGYWIPKDGRSTSTADYFRNSTLTDQISAIKSKHTLLIADACFSGAIFKSRAAFFDANVAVNKLYELPSRKAITSGTLTEVPDRSAFMEYLIKRLNSNSQKYLTSANLFSTIRESVINNSDVIPQYGIIQKVGDEGGEFVFIRRE